MLNILKIVQDKAIFAMADQEKVVCGLSNSAIFNDVERPQTQIPRSCHFNAAYVRNGTRYKIQT